MVISRTHHPKVDHKKQQFFFSGWNALTKPDLSNAASQFVWGEQLNICLEVVITSVCVRSDGLTGVYHSSLLGVYTMDDYNNGANITHNSRCIHQCFNFFLTIHNHRPFLRRVYRQIDGDSFLYYWDWGPNSGIKLFQKWVCWSYRCLQELTGWCPMNGGKEKGNLKILWHLSFFRFKILILHEISKLLH